MAEDNTFCRLMNIFDKAQAVWAKTESLDAGSGEWQRLRAEHAALAKLYRDVRSGISTVVN